MAKGLEKKAAPDARGEAPRLWHRCGSARPHRRVRASELGLGLAMLPPSLAPPGAPARDSPWKIAFSTGARRPAGAVSTCAACRSWLRPPASGLTLATSPVQRSQAQRASRSDGREGRRSIMRLRSFVYGSVVVAAWSFGCATSDTGGVDNVSHGTGTPGSGRGKRYGRRDQRRLGRGWLERRWNALSTDKRRRGLDGEPREQGRRLERGCGRRRRDSVHAGRKLRFDARLRGSDRRLRSVSAPQPGRHKSVPRHARSQTARPRPRAVHLRDRRLGRALARSHGAPALHQRVERRLPLDERLQLDSGREPGRPERLDEAGLGSDPKRAPANRRDPARDVQRGPWDGRGPWALHEHDGRHVDAPRRRPPRSERRAVPDERLLRSSGFRGSSRRLARREERGARGPPQRQRPSTQTWARPRCSQCAASQRACACGRRS